MAVHTNIAIQLEALKSLPLSEHLKSGFTYSQKPVSSTGNYTFINLNERNRSVVSAPPVKTDPVFIPSPTNKPLPSFNNTKTALQQISQPTQPPVITIDDDDLLSLDVDSLIAQHQQSKNNTSNNFNNNTNVPPKKQNVSPYGNLNRNQIEAKIKEIVDNLLSTQNELIALFQNPSEDSQFAEKKEQLRATKESLDAEKKILEDQLAQLSSSNSVGSSYPSSTPYDNEHSFYTDYTSSDYTSSTTSQYDFSYDNASSWDRTPAPVRPVVRETTRNVTHERWGKEEFEWSIEVKALLLSVYGYHNFRERQLEIINATLAKRDVFVLMPTGGGKSLCFQIPALVRKGVTIVICPLIALIQDQVESLRALGIEADFIGSGQSEQRESNIFKELYRERPTLKLLYVTPEKVVQSGRTMSTLTRLYNSGNLAHVVVDEAHCVSQWGHEFRKDYMALHVFKESFPDVPIIALTATATSQVKKDVINKLRMNNPLIFQTSFNRPNLRYEIRKKSKAILSDMVAFIKEKYPNKCGIIYCLARKDCEKVAQKLRDEYRIKAEHYHAQVPNDERNKIQKRWLNDETKIIVATIAFGLGINKPDVRFVMHYSLPKSVEGYYQEAGRAGRDGGVSHCILYYSYADKFKVEFLIKNEENTTHEFKTHLIENLNTMVSYCENQVDCRRKLQLQYLGEDFDITLCRGTCDNCFNARPHITKDVTESAKDMIELLKEANRNSQITSNQLVQVFRGKRNQTMTSKGFTSLAKFNCGSQYNKVDAERILRYLVDKQIIKEVTEANGLGYPVTYISLNERSAINFKNSKERVVLQFTETKKSSSSNSSNSGASSASKSKKKAASKAPKDFILYGKLHTLRTKIAQDTNQEAFHIFSNATLEEMSSAKPSSLDEMSHITGVGKIKLKKFGSQFLEVVLQHKQQNDTSRSQFFQGANQAPKRSVPSYDQSILEDEDIVEEDDDDEDDDYEDYDPQQYTSPVPTKNSAFFQSTKRLKSD